MSRHSLPRRGSVAFKALDRLHQLGGKAMYSDLVSVMSGEFRSTSRFVTCVVEVLERGKLAWSDGVGLEITAAGRALVANAPAVAAPAPVLPVAGPVYRPDPKPLDLSRLQVSSGRVGALEYRSIPSLMAGERVPFMGEGKAND